MLSFRNSVATAVLALGLCVQIAVASAGAQSSGGQAAGAIRFDAQSRVFRIDAGGMTYAFGINDQNELQTVFWGGRLKDADKLPPAHTSAEVASFDSAATTTPLEFAGWGGGL